MSGSSLPHRRNRTGLFGDACPEDWVPFEDAAPEGGWDLDVPPHEPPADPDKR
ncbi:hypothetical protein [Kribbella sp. NPDC004875]|uniref:hypothetical protein n=1 Tax=Kribbella sp. NPDC004875 TaxID=3364107 RepID=UPI0036883942